MPNKNDFYEVEIRPSHLKWGEFRNHKNRVIVYGESYVKIPSEIAREFNIIRGSIFRAYFTNSVESFEIKASGNGPIENDVQLAKQFEGVGSGACKAFTPWYKSNDAEVGDIVKVTFLSSSEILFEIIKK